MNYRLPFAGLLAIACLQSTLAAAGEIAVDGAWARASVNAGSNSAAYMTLTIEGEGEDRLIAVATPLAERAELHGHTMEDGIARMHPVEAIDVAAGEPVALEPGGLHIMLMGLKEKLEPDTVLPLTLSFEQAGEITIELPVEPINHRPQKKHDG